MANERQRLLAVTILAGGLCGLSAVAFHLTIGWLENLMINRANFAPGHSWIFWTLLSPAVGGLIVGLGLTYWAPAAAGFRLQQVEVAATRHRHHGNDHQDVYSRVSRVLRLSSF